MLLVLAVIYVWLLGSQLAARVVLWLCTVVLAVP
jgi:hypothetical protein